MPNNFSSKVTVAQLNVFIPKLANYHWEYGEEAFGDRSSYMINEFIKQQAIDLNEEERESLFDLLCGSTLRKGSVTQADIDQYDDPEPPDLRTDAEIHADRLKEFTPEQIAEWGLEAFEIKISDEYAGKYTFDAIYNGEFPDTTYQGEHQDPVMELIMENCEARIEAARNLPAIRAAVERVMRNHGTMDETDLETLSELLDIDPDTLY